jgi:hypothetical protein
MFSDSKKSWRWHFSALKSWFELQCSAQEILFAFLHFWKSFSALQFSALQHMSMFVANLLVAAHSPKDVGMVAPQLLENSYAAILATPQCSLSVAFELSHSCILLYFLIWPSSTKWYTVKSIWKYIVFAYPKRERYCFSRYCFEMARQITLSIELNLQPVSKQRLLK